MLLTELMRFSPITSWYPHSSMGSANVTHVKHNFWSQNSSTHVIFLYSFKVFDSVPHQRLLLKLDRIGIRGHLLRWIEAFLLNQHQQVVIDGHASELAAVTSRINLRASSVPAIIKLCWWHWIWSYISYKTLWRWLYCVQGSQWKDWYGSPSDRFETSLPMVSDMAAELEP